jgi:hypothetical protein
MCESSHSSLIRSSLASSFIFQYTHLKFSFSSSLLSIALFMTYLSKVWISLLTFVAHEHATHHIQLDLSMNAPIENDSSILSQLETLLLTIPFLQRLHFLNLSFLGVHQVSLLQLDISQDTLSFSVPYSLHLSTPPTYFSKYRYHLLTNSSPNGTLFIRKDTSLLIIVSFFSKSNLPSHHHRQHTTYQCSFLIDWRSATS